jgi:hypothetical protein
MSTARRRRNCLRRLLPVRRLLGSNERVVRLTPDLPPVRETGSIHGRRDRGVGVLTSMHDETSPIRCRFIPPTAIRYVRTGRPKDELSHKLPLPLRTRGSTGDSLFAAAAAAAAAVALTERRRSGADLWNY